MSPLVRPSPWIRLTPSRLFVASFVGLVAFGTLGLGLLPGLYAGPRLDWLDSLFTATSAVCVTGLIVVDTQTYFTPAGKAFLLLLIQLGGLGILTFSSVAAILFGRRLPLGQEMLVSEASKHAPEVDFRRLLRGVVVYTFACEAVGAALLAIRWGPELGVAPALGHAVFHSVSAFCNAGFSTFSDSLVGWRESPAVLVPVMALIVAGGLGFLVLVDVRQNLGAMRKGLRFFRPSLHSRVVLVTTALLLVGGAALFTVFEWRGVLAALPPGMRALNGLFASVTARTAGFATFDYGHATEGTAFLTMMLMFVGGAPGSTAGGVKVTTVAVLGLVATARLRGRDQASVWSRGIPDDTVRRALELTLLVAVLSGLALFALAAVEPAWSGPGGVEANDFRAHAFEVTSAFHTVGLSMGTTERLSPAGKVIIVLLMFVGRVGPLTFVAAVAASANPRTRFRYAREDVAIG